MDVVLYKVCGQLRAAKSESIQALADPIDQGLTLLAEAETVGFDSARREKVGID